MTFTLSSIAALFVILGVVVAIAVGTLVALAAPAIATHRQTRLARHLSIPAYYGRLATSH